MRLVSASVGALAGCSPADIGACWVQQLGRESASASAMVIDGDDNLFVAGDGLVAEEPGAGEGSRFIVKYDAQGVQQWARQFEEEELERPRAVLGDGHGGVYVVGRIQVNRPTERVYDLHVTRFDAAGAQLWSRRTPLEDASIAAAAIDADNNIHVLGTNEDESVKPDPFLIKLDGEAGVLWRTQFDVEPLTEGHVVALDGQGHAYVAGRQFLKKTSGDWGDVGFVSKLSPTGELMWIESFEEPWIDTMVGIMAEEDRVHVVGRGAHAFLFEYDPAGARRSATELVDAGARLARIVSDGQGGVDVYLATHRTSTAIHGCHKDAAECMHSSTADHDFIARKYDAAGALVWSQAMPAEEDGLGDEDDMVAAVGVDSTGNVVIAGTRTFISDADRRHALLARFCAPE